MTTRRQLLIGFASLLAAPVIVRVSSIMPISMQPKRVFTGKFQEYPEGIIMPFPSDPAISRLMEHLAELNRVQDAWYQEMNETIRMLK